MKTRGRRTLLCAKLQKEICSYLSDCCTIRTACEAVGISESSFHLWVEKGEQGESPYKEFSEAVTRARGRAKARIVRSLLDEKDWRARLEVLARVFPDEYGRREIVPLPVQPPRDLSKSVRLTCYGAPDVDLGEFMEVEATYKEMKAKLQAAGVKTEFPIFNSAEELAAYRAKQAAEDADASGENGNEAMPN
jgi:hypothetical protein